MDSLSDFSNRVTEGIDTHANETKCKHCSNKTFGNIANYVCSDCSAKGKG